MHVYSACVLSQEVLSGCRFMEIHIVTNLHVYIYILYISYNSRYVLFVCMDWIPQNKAAIEIMLEFMRLPKNITAPPTPPPEKTVNNQRSIHVISLCQTDITHITMIITIIFLIVSPTNATRYTWKIVTLCSFTLDICNLFNFSHYKISLFFQKLNFKWLSFNNRFTVTNIAVAKSFITNIIYNIEKVFIVPYHCALYMNSCYS